MNAHREPPSERPITVNLRAEMRQSCGDVKPRNVRGRCQKTTTSRRADRGEHSEAARAFAEAVIRSVELIVQPDANDVVDEMRVCEGLSARGTGNWCGRVAVVQRTEVHVKILYFVGPTGN
jgi:hypothetical protein